MRSRESEIAVQLHLKQWAEDIRDCQSRPENVTVKQWCEQHGITKSNYYWRLRQVRRSCLDAVQASGKGFVELPVPVETTVTVPVNPPIEVPASVAPVAVLRTSNGLSVEIAEHASAELVKTLLGVLANA